MYTESDLLPLSGLQHILFCKRQCALIHIEQAWAENLFTAEGRIMHEKVHSESHETRKGVRTEFSVPLRSFRLGLIGVADVVEFEKNSVTPIEYKRGRSKKESWDRVQLCAQAMCLEEMLDTDITEGALFYGKTRRRQNIVFDEALRRETEETARRFHELVGTRQTPPPEYTARCESCSFVDACMPRKIKNRSATAYLKGILSS
ncbi:CRISPR-associated protein Cas4 [Desulfonema ishimotonii]|uniref:CRISPR-associated exonuclease Cas4 n=1 Tax=Desulfonema ishimotonii TaxID=45657 RepID=A0A401G404_9BACT|nr:CRISPR-associated protein Cas4 [Desulfonema ishimotonii]GBC63960.1 CRISPR-associated protein Cas4 [Desulfonema ishimotonii]